MDLRNFLLETLYNKTCFLCFKTADPNVMMHIRHDELEISDKYFNHTVNLDNIMKYLFPSNDIVQSKSCMNCSDLLIEIYVVLQRRKYIQDILSVAVKKLSDKLQKLSYLENSKTYTINLNSVSSDSAEKLTKEIINSEDSEVAPRSDHVSEDTHKNLITISKEDKYVLPDFAEKLTKEFIHSEQSEVVPRNDHISEITPKNLITISKEDKYVLPEKTTEQQCLQCLKILKNNKSMLSHIKSHIRQRNKKYYYCNNCTYKTLCKTTLEGHINKQHLKVRPFVCNTCFKGFFTKSNLTEHKQSHNYTKELCDVCGYVFRQKKSLIMHLRLHSDTRPYECNLCGKRFVTSGRRSDHVKRSHMVKTESCLICDKQFGLKKELIRHVRNVHS